eukprot:scaffold4408_cov143-Isochrysis_galbana.AAC.3
MCLCVMCPVPAATCAGRQARASRRLGHSSRRRSHGRCLRLPRQCPTASKSTKPGCPPRSRTSAARTMYT